MLRDVVDKSLDEIYSDKLTSKQIYLLTPGNTPPGSQPGSPGARTKADGRIMLDGNFNPRTASFFEQQQQQQHQQILQQQLEAIQQQQQQQQQQQHPVDLALSTPPPSRSASPENCYPMAAASFQQTQQQKYMANIHQHRQQQQQQQQILQQQLEAIHQQQQQQQQQQHPVDLALRTPPPSRSASSANRQHRHPHQQGIGQHPADSLQQQQPIELHLLTPPTTPTRPGTDGKRMAAAPHQQKNELERQGPPPMNPIGHDLQRGYQLPQQAPQQITWRSSGRWITNEFTTQQEDDQLVRRFPMPFAHEALVSTNAGSASSLSPC